MRTVDSGGTRIAVAEYGPREAPPLVLLHSLGLDHSMWSDAIERFAGPYHVICPDLRGHGASDAPAGPYAAEDLALDVLAAIDQVAGRPSAHVCGLSLGGLVALWLGLFRADRVRTLSVVASAARVGTQEGWQARMDAIARDGLAAARDVILERFFSRPLRARSPRVRRAHGGDADAHDDGRLSPGCCAMVRDTDLRKQVQSLAVPLLVVAGGSDIACPPEAARQLTEGPNGGVFLEIEGAGHLVPLEEPDAFAASLTAFLAGHQG